MIGLYCRIVRGSTAALCAACALLPLLLLVHPYLAMMAAALFAAAPMTLILRRDTAWRRPAIGLAVSCLCVTLVAMLLGYTDGKSPGGYGRFSLNLLAPLFPVRSWLIPGFENADLDATGGQLADDGYLGFGLILLAGVAFITTLPAIRRAAFRHAGLSLCCLALWLLALSTKIYAGKLLLFRLHTAVGPLEMIRTSSRLFWPISYIVLVGSIAVLAARKPRLAGITLLVCAALQCLDGGAVRSFVYARMNVPQPWLFDPEELRPLIRQAHRLIVLPVYGCHPGDDTALMQVLWLGAETRIPTNTAYLARIVHPQSCDTKPALERPPDAGDLLVIQPGLRREVLQRPWAASLCRPVAGYVVCSTIGKS